MARPPISSSSPAGGGNVSGSSIIIGTSSNSSGNVDTNKCANDLDAFTPVPVRKLSEHSSITLRMHDGDIAGPTAATEWEKLPEADRQAIVERLAYVHMCRKPSFSS